MANSMPTFVRKGTGKALQAHKIRRAVPVFGDYDKLTPRDMDRVREIFRALKLKREQRQDLVHGR